MSSTRPTSRHMIDVDLTPMIDVVLLLIIFFMLTSRFGDLRRTEIDLPRQPGDAEPDANGPALIIDLTRDGRTLVDSHAVTIDELERLAVAGLVSGAASGAAFDVLIRPDQSVPARRLDEVLARLAAVGVNAWKLGTFEPEGGMP